MTIYRDRQHVMLTNRKNQSTSIKKIVNRLINHSIYNPEHDCLLCGCSTEPRNSSTTNIPLVCTYCSILLPYSNTHCNQCSIPLDVKNSLCGKCQTTPPAFDHTITATLYTHENKHLIWRIKKNLDLKMIDILTNILQKNMLCSTSNIDALTYTPMYWKKNLSNGGNHSFLIANALSKKTKIPLIKDAFIQASAKTEQKHLSAHDRKTLRRNLYHLKKDLRGLTIGIVDDIMTTGATMNELSHVLKAHGATAIYALILARTPLKN